MRFDTAAVTISLDEKTITEAAVGNGPGDELGQVVGLAGEAAGHEAGAQGHGHGQRPEGGGDDALGLGLGDVSGLGGGAGLALGEAVNLVVVHDEGEVNVAADGGEEVVAALAIGAAVAALHDHGEPGVGEFRSRGHGQGPAVDAVEAVRVRVARDAAGAPDPGDEADVMLGDSQLGQG
jgi:hypothetical protein